VTVGNKHKHKHNKHEHAPGIWVYSDLNPDGSASYIVTISASDDVALSLKADAAVRYVAAVYRAAVIALHDAAVFQQLTGPLGLDIELAGSMIIDMRKDREPVQVTATAPLKYEPVVSASSFKPYVHVWARDQRITQWTPADCFQHAGYVMQALAAVDLDSGYYRYLVHTVGLDEPRARAAVNDLGNFGLRDDEPQDPLA
jgi:hypothetical protein